MSLSRRAATAHQENAAQRGEYGSEVHKKFMRIFPRHTSMASHGNYFILKCVRPDFTRDRNSENCENGAGVGSKSGFKVNFTATADQTRGMSHTRDVHNTASNIN